MKKWNKFLKAGSVMLALSLVLSACGGGSKNTSTTTGSASSDTEVFELNVNNFGPSTGVFAKEIFEPWGKLVEEKTSGKVQVNLYHGSALGDAPAVLDDVKGGVYEVGLAWTPYVVDTEFFPFTIGDLPFAATNDIKLNNDIFNEFGQKYLGGVSEEVVVMGIAAGVNNYFFTRDSINSVEGLKKKSIRVVGSNEAEMIKAWGGVPVSVSGGELYESLQKGIIDVSVTAIDSTIDRSLYEVTPFMIDVPIKTIQMMPIMNKSFYEKLPDDLKTVFDSELNPALTQLVLESNVSSNDKSRERFEEAVSGKGGIAQLATADEEFLKDKAKVVWDSWIQDANAKGFNGEEMLSEYMNILKAKGVGLPFN